MNDHTVLDTLGNGHRRDLRQIKSVLGKIREKDAVAATVRSEPFGVFMIRGSAILSVATEGLLVGGQPLETVAGSGNPVPDLIGLTRAETVSTTDADFDVTVVGHGDIVEASFEQQPSGRFTVTGCVVEAALRDVLTVGGWHLTEPGGGIPAVRLCSLRVVAPADTHSLPVPGRLRGTGAGDVAG